MKSTTLYQLFALLAASLLLPVVGCTPPAVAVNTGNMAGDVRELSLFDIAPVYFGLADGPGRVGIIEPEVFLYDISEGGVLEFRDDWSSEASRLAALSAAIALKREGYNPLVLPDPNHAADFFSLRTRMRYHANAFQSDFFAERNRELAGIEDPIVFSIGRIGEMCDLYGVDAFLYIYGFEEKFSDRRREFLNDSLIVHNSKRRSRRSSESVMIEPPSGNVYPAERTFLAVILAEKDGHVSWYRHILAQDDNDMRRKDHSLRMMEALLE